METLNAREGQMDYMIMQIETSNFCTLTCDYCPHPSQVSSKGNMSMELFKKCIAAVNQSDNPVYQGKKFVWLNHFGEPLLNPQLEDFVSYAVSQNVEVAFNSNAVDYDKKLFPRERWQSLARAGLKGVGLSAHVKSERKLREHIGDVLKIINSETWVPKPENIHDWAGQVNVKTLGHYDFQEKIEKPCAFETGNAFCIKWDGRLAACCYDIEGMLPLTIDDVLAEGFKFQTISLCSRCNLWIGDNMREWNLSTLKAVLD